MYKPKYTFWNEKQFPGFVDSLDRIYDDSIENYLKRHKEDKKDLKMIETFMKDLENYYSSLLITGIVTQKNWKNILKQLESISLIVIPTKRDLYGATLGYQISINPDIEAKYGFSSEELKQLCVSHELGHVINNKWKMEAKELSKKIYKNPKNKGIFDKLDIDDYRYLVFGFDLIDEVIAEEVAEKVTYRLMKKKRPDKSLREFSHNKYISNYTLYGELYNYAYEFARKLDYVSTTKNCSEEEYMLRFVRRSFDEDFIKNIEKEIDNSDSDKCEKFITMLACMGKIKAASYEVVGLNKKHEDINVDKYIDTFNETIKRR